jgi:predicted nucleic acid-binding protein
MARRAEEQQRSDQFPMLLNKLKQQISIENITWISLEIPRMYSDVVKLTEDTSGKLNFNDSLIALFCKEFSINFIITFDQDFDMIAWLKRICQTTEVKKVFAEDDQRNPHNP